MAPIACQLSEGWMFTISLNVLLLFFISSLKCSCLLLSFAYFLKELRLVNLKEMYLSWWFCSLLPASLLSFVSWWWKTKQKNKRDYFTCVINTENCLIGFVFWNTLFTVFLFYVFIVSSAFVYASAMVTSTSTPGSMLMEVICLTISDGLCRSIRRLWILIWKRSQVLEPSPQGVFLVVMRRVWRGTEGTQFSLSQLKKDMNPHYPTRIAVPWSSKHNMVILHQVPSWFLVMLAIDYLMTN